MTQSKDKISIFNSHSFKRSPYKAKIISAIQNPVNKELLFQLKDYIDFDSIPDEYKSKNKQVTDSDKDLIKEGKNKETSSKDGVNSTEPRVNFKEKMDSEEKVDDASSDGAEDVEPKSKNDTVTSSISIKAQTVLNSASCCDANKLQSDVILATLNSIDNTSGVYRVTCVDPNEVWIYYKDDINLNNVMPNVIDILASSGFYYLTFNRLARTQNAIVFEFDPANVIIGDVNGKTEEE